MSHLQLNFPETFHPKRNTFYINNPHSTKLEETQGNPFIFYDFFSRRKNNLFHHFYQQARVVVKKGKQQDDFIKENLLPRHSFKKESKPVKMLIGEKEG